MPVFSLVNKRYNNNSQKLSLLNKERDRNKEVQSSGIGLYEWIYSVCSILSVALAVIIGAKTLHRVIRPENEK